MPPQPQLLPLVQRALSGTHFNRLCIRLSSFLPHFGLPEKRKSLGDFDDPPFSPIRKPNPPKVCKEREKKRKKSTNETSLVSSKNMKRQALPQKSNLPFDFRYSYSETNPLVQPIGYRESPKFSPFGPGRLDRKWTGTCAPAGDNIDLEKAEELRNLVLGDPLSEEEISELVERYRHSDCNRQINLGKGGVTHNMLEDIHSHFKRAEAVRIKCLGVPTLDMDNVCFHLEDKSGGKIIYKNINILLLYRGRNYDPKARPLIPLMLWRPYAPIYPRLVPKAPAGLSFEEAKDMKSRGLIAPPLMKLTRNGVYVNVVSKVRDAFNSEEVVRLDCSHLGMNHCKKIGVKLKDLVPCVPILIKDDQVILWRGKLEANKMLPSD